VMPKVLQWFTANIGLHHIHHIASRIPNYRLQRCYDENPELHDVTRLTLAGSVKTLWLTLWDEDEKRLIGFRQLRRAHARLARGLPDGAPIEPTKAGSVPPGWR